jgi:hypothetical protein
MKSTRILERCQKALPPSFPLRRQHQKRGSVAGIKYSVTAEMATRPSFHGIDSTRDVCKLHSVCGEWEFRAREKWMRVLTSALHWLESMALSDAFATIVLLAPQASVGIIGELRIQPQLQPIDALSNALIERG